MKKNNNLIIGIIAIVAIAAVYFVTRPGASKTANTKDTIVLGAAVSLTGKYSTNGKHTQNGYNLAVERLNGMGGVKVDGKSYKFDII